MDNSNPASLRLLLIGAAAAAGAYGAYRFRSASRPDGKRRQADAAQVARWRAQLFASKHWAPIVEYAARFGVALQPPPPTKDDEPKLPSEPYNWAFVARALNFLNNTLPYSVLDSSFLHKQELLDMIDAALLDTPAVDCLGGQRANQLIHDRFYRWVAAVKWDELTGVGKAVLRERVWQWTSERRSFAKWYQDNHHLVVDSDGKDLKPMKPVLFVCGAPRTGTTLLQSLLGCAPEARSTRLFESTYVVEPSTSDLPFPRTSEAELDRDPRLPRLKAIFNQGRAAFGSDFFDKMAASHPTIGNPNQADEDSVVMWYYGCYLMYEFLTAGEVDSWADMVNDAEWQEWSEVVARGIKRFYQMLGVGFEPSGWWVGKSPYHAQHTVALAKTFPEAHFITPTRDPKQTVASLCRTQEAIINGFMLKPESILNDRRLLGRWTARESWGLRSVGITPEFEGEHAKNCVAVRYEDLVRDPVGTVAVIHKACGLQEPSKGHVEAIEKHLRDQPQGLHGRNKYSLEAYGLVETDLEPTKK